MNEAGIISTQPDSFFEYIQKIWRHRSMVFTFAYRDIRLKYSQTYFGISWAVFQPLLSITVFTIVFNWLLKVKSESPYVLFILSGLICWNLFNNLYTQASYSLINNQEAVKKMPIPKIIFPISKAFGVLIELFIGLALLGLALMIWGSGFSWKIFLFPIPILSLFIFGISLTMTIISFSIRQRDLLHLFSIAIQFSIWITPVFYPVSIIPQQYRDMVYINPVASSIDFFRWTLGIQESFSVYFIITVFVSILFFILSILFFKRAETTISDYV